MKKSIHVNTYKTHFVKQKRQASRSTDWFRVTRRSSSSTSRIQGRAFMPLRGFVSEKRASSDCRARRQPTCWPVKASCSTCTHVMSQFHDMSVLQMLSLTSVPNLMERKTNHDPLWKVIISSFGKAK
jgi:hypothetical protein